MVLFEAVTAVPLLLLLCSALLAFLGHVLRLLRWEQFIRIYEPPRRADLLRSMGGGYVIDFFLPFHLGDVFRAVWCGRRMRSGIGFSLATVLMDRFLDVWVVALAFGAFRLLGRGGAAAATAAGVYLLFALLLAAALALVTLAPVRDLLKKACLAVCSIFNDTLKLDGMAFFWGLINTFKDLRRMKLGRLLLNTALMWTAYLGSYLLLARSMTAAGGGSADLADVFVMLFGGGARAGGVLMALWFLLPALLLLAAPLLPAGMRGVLSQATAPDTTAPYHNLLPQADPADRAAFLSEYFGLENKDTVDKFIEINQGITILQDYSSGSNATTMLCMDEHSTFYRKYAFGADGKKLAEQLAWLQARADTLPLCDILRYEVGPDFCWYDMAYDPRAVGLFRFLHSNPVERSRTILHEVLDTLQTRLYTPTAAKADPAVIEKYLTAKVDANLARIREAHGLRELAAADTVFVNGRACRGLPRLAGLFDHARLAALFADDPVGVIHADLTIENIICRTDAEGPGAWYLIDPNTGSGHESPFLDYGKLLQSLHGSYEFLMMTPHVTVRGESIEFTCTRSAAYDALLADLENFLRERFSERQLQSIFLHELIHWLRLMPYKLGKDRKRAPMFFGGLLLVANDIAERWPALLGEDNV